jgi:hypothetical protein
LELIEEQEMIYEVLIENPNEEDQQQMWVFKYGYLKIKQWETTKPLDAQTITIKIALWKKVWNLQDNKL